MVQLKDIYYAILSLSILTLLWRWKRVDRSLHIMLVLLVAAISTEKLHDTFYPAPFTKAMFHVYQIIETGILSWYYWCIFESERNKKIVVSGFAVFLLWFVFDYLLKTTNLFTYKRSDMNVEGVLVSIYSVLFLLERYAEKEPVVLKTFPHFWIVIANLMFYSVSLLFYVFQVYLLKQSPYYKSLQIIPQIANLVLYSFYCIAFLCPRSTAQISTKK